MKMDFREALVLNRQWGLKKENRFMRWLKRLCFLRKTRGSNRPRAGRTVIFRGANDGKSQGLHRSTLG